MVFESWEGSHNVLCLQVVRDMQRYGLHEHLFAALGALLDSATQAELAEAQDLLLGQLEHTQQRLERVLSSSPGFLQTHVRRAIDHLALLVQAACLLTEAGWELSRGLDTDKPAALAFFVNRHLRPGYDPLDDDRYLDRVSQLAGSM